MGRVYDVRGRQADNQNLVQEAINMQTATLDQPRLAPTKIPVGKIKSFGAFGPQYEVGQAIRQLDDGDWLVQVTMVGGGETAEYRLTRLLDDPDAR